jgi:hypothetical protein
MGYLLTYPLVSRTQLELRIESLEFVAPNRSRFEGRLRLTP